MLHHAGTVPSSSSRKSRAESVDTGDNSDEESDYQDSNQDGDGHADSSRKNANGGEGHVVKAKNREHAKNTRMRKKNYIETLKEDISHLSSTRDLRERNRKIMLSKLAEQTAIRKKALYTFFHFRTSLEMNPDRWANILEEDFECVMPITPYRSFPPHQVLDSRRHLTGITAMIFDALSLHVMLQSLSASRTMQQERKQVKMAYEVGLECSIMSDDTFMCKWRLGTVNLVSCGGAFEVSKHGMLFATFSAENKLRQLELNFDVMSFMQQLRRTSERNSFQVIPNIIYGSAEEDRRLARVNHAPSSSAGSSLPSQASLNGSTCSGSGTTYSTAGSSGGSRDNNLSSSGSASPSNNSTHSSGSAHILSSQASDSAVPSAPNVGGQPIASNAAAPVAIATQANTPAAASPQSMEQRHDALGLFMESPEARAVIKATEPFDFIFVNKRFSERFCPEGAKAAAFASFIRPGDNDIRVMSEVSSYLKHKLPHCAILNCAPISDNDFPRPCMCSFHPLFADGNVFQYLVIIEALSGIISIQNLQQVPDHAGKKYHSKSSSHSQASSSLSGSGSGSASGSRSRTGSSGLTDHVSSSSYSGSSQHIGTSDSSSTNDISRMSSSKSSASAFTADADASMEMDASSKNRTRSAVGSIGSLSFGASLTPRSSARNPFSNSARKASKATARVKQAPGNGWLNDAPTGPTKKRSERAVVPMAADGDGDTLMRMATQLTSSDGSLEGGASNSGSGSGSPMQQDSGTNTPPSLEEAGRESPSLLDSSSNSGSERLRGGSDKGSKSSDMNCHAMDFYDKLFEDGTFDAESMGKM